MLLNPLCSPSTRYITAPITTTRVTTDTKNTEILRRLATRASRSICASCRYSASLNTRKMRSRRRNRTTASDWLPGRTRLT